MPVADVLDRDVIVPITATDLPWFEQTLRAGNYTPSFVMDQLAAEREATDIIKALQRKAEERKTRKQYPTLFNTKEANAENLHEWYDLKPSRTRRAWNWLTRRRSGND